MAVDNQTILISEKEATTSLPTLEDSILNPSVELVKLSRENGELRSNGITEAKSDRSTDFLSAVGDKHIKSRY